MRNDRYDAVVGDGFSEVSRPRAGCKRQQSLLRSIQIDLLARSVILMNAKQLS